MNEQRVMVTCWGAVTQIGIGIVAFWQGLQAGISGIAGVTHFNPTGFCSQLALRFATRNSFGFGGGDTCLVVKKYEE